MDEWVVCLCFRAIRDNSASAFFMRDSLTIHFATQISMTHMFFATVAIATSAFRPNSASSCVPVSTERGRVKQTESGNDISQLIVAQVILQCLISWVSVSKKRDPAVADGWAKAEKTEANPETTECEARIVRL